jgi:hypothetical protein
MGNESENQPKRENIQETLKKYKKQIESNPDAATKAVGNEIPRAPMFNPQEFEKTMAKETDPDLMTSYEVVKLPSRGLFYQDRLSEVNVEYMTSRDEDLLTTPSLIDNGTVIDVLLRRKIKTPNVNIDDLLTGDRSAIILFLRTSSYGADYSVQVPDPRTGIPFKATVDLLRLRYKDVNEIPDEYGHFKVEIPMRKKIVTFKLLTSGEETKLFRKSQAIQEAYSEEFSQYATLKLKSHIVAINEKTDRSYIDKFVDAMPALDAYTIRKKILEVSPDVDMAYEFMAKDGYKFFAQLTVGVDFFFPNS